jgi:hypothetical protein
MKMNVPKGAKIAVSKMPRLVILDVEVQMTLFEQYSETAQSISSE